MFKISSSRIMMENLHGLLAIQPTRTRGMNTNYNIENLLFSSQKAILSSPSMIGFSKLLN